METVLYCPSQVFLWIFQKFRKTLKASYFSLEIRTKAVSRLYIIFIMRMVLSKTFFYSTFTISQYSHDVILQSFLQGVYLMVGHAFMDPDIKASLKRSFRRISKPVSVQSKFNNSTSMAQSSL